MTVSAQMRFEARIVGCIAVGARLLGAMLADEWVRELSCALELDDLFDPRHRVVLREIRDLQLDRSAAIGPLEVADAIAMRDLAMGTSFGEAGVDVAFVGALVCERPYGNWRDVNCDLAYLRRCARERKALAA